MNSQADGLVNVIRASREYDAFSSDLNDRQWHIFCGYLQAFPLAAGQALITEGASDRMVYFVESGSVTVHLTDEGGQIRQALVGPGSVVGEGAFLSRLPRMATAVGTGVARLWCLTPMRFNELAQREPEIAVKVALALGGVVARRMANISRRMTVV